MSRCRSEQGFVLITAMAVLLIMLILGVATVKMVDVQSSQTGVDRNGEAAFNLAESVMDAEAYQLQVAWPTSAAAALPACSQSSAHTVGCEGSSLSNSLPASYAGTEYTGATWSAQVLDDTGGSSYYSDSIRSTAPSWDSNANGLMWVRAQATVQGRTRTVVEQMIRQDTVLTVPDNTVTAGGIYTENMGNKVIIEARDSYSGLTGPVEVRCGGTGTSPTQGQGNCEGWSADKGQLDPPTAYGAGYVDPNGGYQTLSNAQIQDLVNTAIAAHTYYATGCPPEGTAGVVVVQSANCSYQGNGTWNTSSTPGALVFLNGTLDMSGNENFYGVIYMANQSGLVPQSGSCQSAQMNTVVTVDGNAQVFGAIFADHCGVVATGESKTNVNFASNALNGLYAATAAMPAQNTFRIIPNS